ncbi:HutD family protein [bacterium]|nr:MAG: HutD family protein [bacterium]
MHCRQAMLDEKRVLGPGTGTATGSDAGGVGGVLHGRPDRQGGGRLRHQRAASAAHSSYRPCGRGRRLRRRRMDVGREQRRVAGAAGARSLARGRRRDDGLRDARPRTRRRPRRHRQGAHREACRAGAQPNGGRLTPMAHTHRTGRVLRRASYRAMPWKNGGGITHEITVFPSEEAPVWRLSVATIERDGPFSDFTSYDRTIVPLEGHGVILDLSNGERAVLDRPFHPFPFAGELKVDCRLIDGPVRDFNVMTRRAECTHAVEARRIGERALNLAGPEARFVYVFEGELVVEVPPSGAGEHLHVGDTLCLDGSAPVCLRPRADSARVALVRID